MVLFQAILSHSNSLEELYVQDISGTKAVDYMKLQQELSVHCQSSPSVTHPQKGKVSPML